MLKYLVELRKSRKKKENLKKSSHVIIIPVCEAGLVDCSLWCAVDEPSVASLGLEVKTLRPVFPLGHPEIAEAGYHRELAPRQPQVRGRVAGCPPFVPAADCCSAVGRPICQSHSAGCFPQAAVPCWVKKCSTGGGQGQSATTTQLEPTGFSLRLTDSKDYWVTIVMK